MLIFCASPRSARLTAAGAQVTYFRVYHPRLRDVVILIVVLAGLAWLTAPGALRP